MLERCRKCKNCHEDLDIEKALGILQMSLMHEIENFDSKDQGEICMMHRKAAAYDIIVETLNKHGLCK